MLPLLLQVRLSRGSPSRALPRVALDLATTVERIQSVRAERPAQAAGTCSLAAPGYSCPENHLAEAVPVGARRHYGGSM